MGVVTELRTEPKTLEQSAKLRNVLYEIRGPVHARAAQLEAEGHRILKLNIGNPAPFGFDAPDEILQDMIAGLPTAPGLLRLQGDHLRAPGPWCTTTSSSPGSRRWTSTTSTWATASPS